MEKQEYQVGSAVNTAQIANDFFNGNNNNTTLERNISNNNIPSSNSNLNNTQSNLSKQNHSNQLSPILIAVIIIIPILAAILSVLYFRKSIFNRSITLPHQNHPGSSTSIHPPVPLIAPPGGTGADRPIDQRRTDRFRRRIIGAIHPRPSRSESIRTVPEYSADPQETEISLAHAQRSPPESNLITRFFTHNHLTNPSRTQYILPQIQPSIAHFSPETNHPLNSNNNHYTFEPPPDYDLSTLNSHPNQSSIQLTSSSSNNLPNPIQVVIPPPNQSSSHHQDHHQNLEIQRTLTSNSDTSSFTSHPNNKPIDPNAPIPTMIHSPFSGLFRTSSQTQHIPIPLMNSSTSSSNNTNSDHFQINDTSRLVPTSETSNPTIETSSPVSSSPINQEVYYRIPPGGPTPQQLSFLTRIGNLTRLGLPRPPQLAYHAPNDEPPPPFDTPSSPHPPPSFPPPPPSQSL